jgi:hypothetical protein
MLERKRVWRVCEDPSRVTINLLDIRTSERIVSHNGACMGLTVKQWGYCNVSTECFCTLVLWIGC